LSIKLLLLFLFLIFVVVKIVVVVVVVKIVVVVVYLLRLALGPPVELAAEALLDVAVAAGAAVVACGQGDRMSL
jgi:hypothetical protein